MARPKKAAAKVSAKPEPKKLLTIIIPIRNMRWCKRDTGRLETLFQSLQKQTVSREQIEVIVADLDSEEPWKSEHEALCAKYGARHIYSKSGRPWNISLARNIGIKNATAPNVMVTDVDCIFARNFVEALLKNLTDETVVHCRISDLPEGYAGPLDDEAAMRTAATLRPAHGLGGCQALRKTKALEVGGYDEIYEGWGADDTDFLYRISQIGMKPIWIEKETAYFHQFHPQDNRTEFEDMKRANRLRLELTKAKQLPAMRNIGGFGVISERDPYEDMAIMVTTFLRDYSLYDCIRAIRRHLPTIAVYIADNGKQVPEKDEFCKLHNCPIVYAPYDSGVGNSRNLCLEAMPKKHKYIVCLEDDIRVFSNTHLKNWQAILDHVPAVGIAGGMLWVVSPDRQDVEQHYEANLSIEGDTFFIKKIAEPEQLYAGGVNYFLCDLILNVWMAKREVLESIKWDPNIKTAPEHCDFFWRLKKDGCWKVAYTDQVQLKHDKMAEGDPEYMKHRKRGDGFLVFAEKHGVEYLWSSWNVRYGLPNPVNITAQYTGKTMPKMDFLREAVVILEANGCKWWIEAGTCLGAIRDKALIEWDPDLDFGLAPGELEKWDKLRADFEAAGFELYKEWKHGKERLELSFRRGGVKVDLFFFYDGGEFWRHGAFGPGKDGRWGDDCNIYLPHYFSAHLFSQLQEIDLGGVKVYVPNPPEKYLIERYGKGWVSPNPEYQYWKHCRAIDRNWGKPKKERTVFIGGVWDILHVGHLNILERAKMLGGRLVVGVLTDEAAEEYKPRPVIPFAERRRLIENLRPVSRTIEQHSSDPTEDLKIQDIKPDYLVHGDDWDGCPGEDYVRECGGKVVFFPYTKGVSTSAIKERLGYVAKTTLRRTPVNNNEVIAIGIKTYMRERTLFKTLDAIAANFPYPYRLYIADDGPMSTEKAWRYSKLEKEGHVILRLPADAGLSAGRNAIVRAVKEPYVLIMDDDILIHRPESIKAMRAVLDYDSDLGLVAGTLKQEINGQPVGGDNYGGGLELKLDGNVLYRLPAKKELLKLNNDFYLYAHQVVNFFLARREVFQDIHWDDRIKIEYEHMDFFLGLMKTKWKAGVCLGAEALHAKPEEDFAYNQHRRNAPIAYFLQKHHIGAVINKF